ncbi:MAG: AAA family ATPase [Brumimicrobium sp.]
MDGLNRNIEKHLLSWKSSKNHKPLLLRGARQVGKTTIVRQFSRHFDHFIDLNLERQKDLAFFQDTDDVKSIYDALVINKGLSVSSNDSVLIFIDEIQEQPHVIKLLRYFYEDLPEIYIIAAGSLLEFALGKVTQFPVGRIQFYYLHPFNFQEYLTAIENKPLKKAFDTIPITKNAHSTLMDTFHRYAIIGGMPEVVNTYIADGNMSQLSNVYNSIWETYKNDIEKYAENSTEEKVIRHILNTAPNFLDERVKFQNFGNSNYRSREVSEAMKSIDAAGLIKLIYPTTALSPPIQSDFKKSPRLQFLDVGIVNNIRGIQAELIGINDLSKEYKGALIPHLITQELISLNLEKQTKPNFWVRDKAHASAEVDLVYQFKNYIIPIEIKSGSTGTLKSLHQFINRTNHNYAIRVYGGDFNIQDQKTPEGKPYKLMNLPYYLGTKIPEYINYFLTNY